MKILYITYDGLTDFIGQSQVLPYLTECAAHGYRLTVISFEKQKRRSLLRNQVQRQCRAADIEWLPQAFRSNPPYIAKAMDMRTMRRVAKSTVAKGQFDMIHCRSYPAAFIGLFLKQRFGIPLLFDMRGFWPDQRRDGQRWRDDSLLGRWMYANWKRHEAAMVTAADHIVVLTEAAKREISRWPSYHNTPISVIPCCADFDLFKVAPAVERHLSRRQLGLAQDAPVLAYLGSIGTVYRIADHLRFFATVKRRDPRARALFIGRNLQTEILSIASIHGIHLSAKDLVTVEAERSQVPFWLGAADVGSCFITPSYSSIGVSPTKLAEYLACGLPVVANRSVGDVQAIVERLDAGHVLRDFAEESMEGAADAFSSLCAIDRIALRNRARPVLDLSNAVDAYERVYDNLGKSVTAVPK